MDDREPWVTVTDDDIRLARRLWLAALEDVLMPVARVTVLYEDLRRLIHTQAQQFAEDFRARQAVGDDPALPTS